MQEELSEQPIVYAPLSVAAATLESAGYELVDVESGTEVVGFAIPHSFGGHCEAVVEYLPGAGILQMTTALTRGQVHPLLATGLVQLLNRLNLMMPAVTFTFDHCDEEGDEIEISTTCYVFDEIQLEQHVKLMVRYLQEALKLSMPAIYHYVTQKLRFKADACGQLQFVAPTLSIDEVLQMVELNQFGRA